MLRFFKRIRQLLLADNMFSKYILYAFGEIVLVVIGILIALQFDAWNDERQADEETLVLLEQVREELAFNINKANGVINQYRVYDTCVYRVLRHQATYEDYKTKGPLLYFFYRNLAVGVNNDAYLNMLQQRNTFSEEQDSIVLRLRHLYGTMKGFLDDRDLNTTMNVRSYIDILRRERTWFYDYTTFADPNDEMINYFLSNPFHLNEIAHYYIMSLQNHNLSALRFRNEALEIYANLSDYLQLPVDQEITKTDIQYDDCLGKYERTRDGKKYQITKESNKYWLNFEDVQSDTVVQRSFRIFPESQSLFNVSNLFGNLTYDELNEVNGFVSRLGIYKSEFRKVEDTVKGQ